MNSPGDNSELRLAALVESSDDAIVSKSLDGVILSWNRSAERMFGYTPEEAIGSHISIIVPEDLIAEEAYVLAQVRSGVGITHYETRRRRKDGTVVDIELTVSPIRNAEGAVIAASKIARDITEQKRLRRVADETSRMKDEFLAVFSHELRTPVNVMLGSARLLQKDMSAEHRANALASLERNAQSLAHLVNAVLETSRMITGRLQLSCEIVDADEVLLEAIETIRPTFDAKGVSVTWTIAPGLRVRGDRDRLHQVMWHVLSNAVKFTAPGESVSVRAVKLGSSVSVTVEDRGIGLDPDYLPHIFQRFWQRDGSYTREHGGLGIGLALVQHVVELHGGQVGAFSPGLGHGTTITIDLPSADVPQGFSPADTAP
jgi:PAS domain S-box-containing protein